jgi:hypothetical protein
MEMDIRRWIKQEVWPQPLGEQPLTCLFGCKGIAVDLDAYGWGSTLTLKHIKLSSGPLVVTGKAQQFKQEGTALGVGRVRSDFVIELLNSS